MTYLGTGPPTLTDTKGSDPTGQTPPFSTAILPWQRSQKPGQGTHKARLDIVSLRNPRHDRMIRRLVALLQQLHKPADLAPAAPDTVDQSFLGQMHGARCGYQQAINLQQT